MDVSSLLHTSVNILGTCTGCVLGSIPATMITIVGHSAVFIGTSIFQTVVYGIPYLLRKAKDTLRSDIGENKLELDCRKQIYISDPEKYGYKHQCT